MSEEMARRHRRVQMLAGIVYWGFPVLLTAVALWMASTAASFSWPALLVPLGLLVLGLVVRPRHRYKPQRWAQMGALFGGVAGLFVTLYPLVLGVSWPAFLFLPALFLGIIIGVWCARYAQRVLLVPLVPELADTQYELAFLLRGIHFTTLTLGPSSVTIQTSARPGRRRGLSPDDLGRTYPLSAVTGVFEVELSGVERLRFPLSLPFAPAGTAGPAVILQASGQDWVLPTDQAAALADLLNRRIAAAR